MNRCLDPRTLELCAAVLWAAACGTTERTYGEGAGGVGGATSTQVGTGGTGGRTSASSTTGASTGSDGFGGVLSSSSTGAGGMSSATTTSSAQTGSGATTSGSSSSTASGPPPVTCYKCNGGDFYLSTAYCMLETVLPDAGGACPAGYSESPVDCTPCWDCRVSNTYCQSQGCCGNWVNTGVVGSGCTCYGCQGFALAPDKTTSCNEAKQWSHSGGPSPNGTCTWPSGSWQSFCGYYEQNCSCWIASCGGTCAL